jgi:hypothetical protein
VPDADPDQLDGPSKKSVGSAIKDNENHPKITVPVARVEPIR